MALAVLEGLRPCGPRLPRGRPGRADRAAALRRRRQQRILVPADRRRHRFLTLRSVDTELGANGAFITGLVATGVENDIDEAAANLVKLRDRFEPHGYRHELYTARFEQFLQMREICAPAWRRMAAGPDREQRSRVKVDRLIQWRQRTTSGSAWTSERRAREPSPCGRRRGPRAASQPDTSRRDGPRHEQSPRNGGTPSRRGRRSAGARCPPRRSGRPRCAAPPARSCWSTAGGPLTSGVMYDDSRAVEEKPSESTRSVASCGAALGYSRCSRLGAAKARYGCCASTADTGSGARLAHQPDFVARRLDGARGAGRQQPRAQDRVRPIGEAWPRDARRARECRGGAPGWYERAPGWRHLRPGCEATGIPPVRRSWPG